jgi:hypothetical protein
MARELSHGIVAAVMVIVAARCEAQTVAEPPRPNFFRDVMHDYRNMVSWETGQWLAIGGVTALAMSEFDEALRVATEDPTTFAVQTLEGGSVYGNVTLQVPLALGWWAISAAVNSPRGAAVGRDLMRAQISAFSWTYAIKYIADRERPNGDPRSFPSGHASATFAGAMVLQEHYGWKVGAPAFAAAAYTAASRITVNKHWASDVVFGAAVGLVAGRTVTIQLRRTPVAVTPVPMKGGVGLNVSWY